MPLSPYSEGYVRRRFRTNFTDAQSTLLEDAFKVRREGETWIWKLGDGGTEKNRDIEGLALLFVEHL